MRSIFVLSFVLFLAACDGNTPLMKASADGANEQVKGMLDSGIAVNEVNNYGWTALSHAARGGDVETAKLLVDEGAKIDVADDVGWTPFLRAAQKGHVEMAKYLVSQGADVNATTNDDWSALMWATLRGKLSMVKYLVTVDGININYLADGRSAILISITENNNDILIVLQDAGARP